MSKILIKIIRFYQMFLSFDKGLLKFLAPGGACKYSPTCSAYFIEVLNKFGLIKGVYLGTKRIISCR